MRDWRTAFEQLERERGEHAPPVPDLPFMLNGLGAVPVFPVEVFVPQKKGAVIKERALPDDGLVSAKVSAKVAPKKPRARKANAAKQKPPARKRKAPTAKPAAAKPAACKTKPRTAAATKPKAKAMPKAKAGTAKPKLAELPSPPFADLLVAALPLRPEPTPLVEVTPLARSASPMHWRKQGLADAIGYWLRHTSRRAAARLPFAKFRRSRKHVLTLEAENAELRRQLEALQVLTEAAQFKFEN